MARWALNPPLQALDRQGMHRLIPSRYSGGGTVLDAIADDARMLEDLILLDGATNDRVQGELYGLSGISSYELVYGIPNAHIIRAAFLHTGRFGSRFNDATRGAWYAGDALETSLAEVTYHRAKHLAEIVVPELPGQQPDEELSEYDDWLADFRAGFHALEPAGKYAACLEAEPVPACYAVPQALARRLLEERSNGILYPSVRRAGGWCVACFRPALVYQPRQDARYAIRLRLEGTAYAVEVESVAM